MFNLFCELLTEDTQLVGWAHWRTRARKLGGP